jgi:DNA topoisomerase-2
MEFKEISYVPGLYKIYGKFLDPKLKFLDEILVNAADNFQRDHTMTMIKIDIVPQENKISVWNNGKGIPIHIHKGQGCYVPEMIFG